MRKKGLFAVMALLIILSLCLIAAPAQAAATYKLTVVVQSTGGGLVSVNEGVLGVNVTATLATATSPNTALITAVIRNGDCPFINWTVVSYSGAIAPVFAQPTNPTTTVTVSDKATVRANFTIPVSSTLVVAAKTIGGGVGGSVAINNAGTSLGPVTTGTTAAKPEVEATAAAGYSFFAWSWNMGFPATNKAKIKFTMCGVLETVTAYFVPLTSSNLRKASYWTFETTCGREVTLRTYTRVAESGSSYTSILTTDKPEMSYSNSGYASLGFPVDASRMILESGGLQNIFGKTSALYKGRDVVTDLWYWDPYTSPYYYGGQLAPSTTGNVNIGMPMTVTTDGFSGSSVLLTADANSGQPVVEVVSTSGFFAGEGVTISDSAASETTNSIATVGPTGLVLTDAAAGQKLVGVSSTTGFSVGDAVNIYSAAGFEVNSIAGINATIMPLTAAVVPPTNTVTVAATFTFFVGDTVNVVNLATGGYDTRVITAIVPGAPGTLTLDSNLFNAYAPGDLVMDNTLTMTNNLAFTYAASGYPAVESKMLTMTNNLANNYTLARTAKVEIPGSSGLPYVIGKTWYYVEHQYIYYKIPLKVTVMDKEMVRVPAGLFECWKVVTEDLRGGIANPVPYRTDWYCEAVHMPVRSEYYIYAQSMQSSAPFTPTLARVQTEVLKKYKLNILDAW